MVQPVYLEGRFSLFFFRYSLWLLLIRMLLVCHGRPAIRCFISLGTEALVPSLTPIFERTFTSITPLNNNLFRKLMQTFMEKAQALITLIVILAVEVRDDINKPLKSQNSNLYYSDLYLEYYYFYQQYKNYLKIAGSLGYKYVYFATRFLKGYILNW